MTAAAPSHWIITSIAGLTAAVAGVPLAALAFAVPGHGDMRVPQRWWIGASVPRWAVIVLPAITAATAALACARRDEIASMLAFWSTAVLGVCLAVVDFRQRRLPHKLTGVIWAVAGSCLVVHAALVANAGRLVSGILAAVVTSAVLLIIALAFPGQLGLGDVNFAGSLALTLGWLNGTAAFLGLLGGFAIQALVTLGQRVVPERSEAIRSGIPMGPSFVAGWALISYLVSSS